MQHDDFTHDAHEALRHATFRISPSSDRTGTRLDGPPLHTRHDEPLVSQPVVAGSIQVPPSGQPIVLMGERQTLGGYPQIGHVITADLPLLARAWPGRELHFVPCTLAEATAAWQTSEHDIARLQAALSFLP